jgi:hypothetical protein
MLDISAISGKIAAKADIFAGVQKRRHTCSSIAQNAKPQTVKKQISAPNVDTLSKNYNHHPNHYFKNLHLPRKRFIRLKPYNMK